MMGAHPMPTAGGTLQLLGTAKGVEITGPGGRMMLTNRMLASLAEFSVSLLDVLQPDADLEPNGDELDGSMGEDDFHHQNAGYLGYPGCPVSDPGGCEHDGREEELGEAAGHHGVNQSREISAANPVML